MTSRTVVSSTAAIRAAHTENRAAPATAAYRLRKSFAAVHFDPAGKGRIVFLRKGTELRVVGFSRLCGCCEVLHEYQLYNVFQADLWGPWSTQLAPNEIKPIRTLVAVGVRLARC